MKLVGTLGAVLFSLFNIHAQTSQVITVAGTGTSGFVNGSGSIAQFSFPQGLDFDSIGNVYVCDNGNHVIRKISGGNGVSTFAGDGVNGHANGSLLNARFGSIMGICVLQNGDIYVAEYGNRIRKISGGTVSNYSGNGLPGSTNGSLTASRYNVPTEITGGINNNIFILDRFNHKIRNVDLGGATVTDFAGTGISGLQNGQALSARFNRPYDFCVDSIGNIFIADRDNNVIRKIDLIGNVTTIAGSGQAGYLDGPGNMAQFNIPAGIAVDKFGNVYVGDRGNNVIRKISPSHVVSTFAGTGAAGFIDGPLDSATFNLPTKIAIDTSHSILYISDVGNHAIRKINLSSIPPPVYCDTVTITLYDTITMFDTINIVDTVFITVTDTVWIHDTIVVHDTVYIVGTPEGSALEYLKAYPNPMKDYLMLDYELLGFDQDMTCAIFDTKGRLLMDISLHDASLGTNRKRVQIPPNIPPGNLVLQMKIGSETYSLKIVKKAN